MGKSRSVIGWWRSGNLGWRLISLGASLGAVGAIAVRLSYTLNHFNPAFLIWSLCLLFLFEVPLAMVLGLFVAAIAVIARLLVPKSAPRMMRAVLIGVVASISTTAMVFALMSLFPASPIPSGITGVTGALVGSAFAIVSYSHTSEL